MIGCASGRVELDKSHPEHTCGTRLTNNVGELQAMCCAVLWLTEQLRIDDSSVALFEWECFWRCWYDPCEKSQREPVERDGCVFLAEAVMNGCSVPSARTELQRWVLSFRGVSVGAACTCAAVPPRCEERENIFKELKDAPFWSAGMSPAFAVGGQGRLCHGHVRS